MKGETVMEQLKNVWKYIKTFRNVLLLVLVLILKYTVNQNYFLTLVTSTLHLIVISLILWDTVVIFQRLRTLKDEVQRWLYNTVGAILIGLFVVIGLSAVVSAVSLAYPINVYTANENKEPESNVIYMTYDPNCEYCKASHTNMLRAARAYADSHLVKVRVVDLSKDTTISQKLNEALDHVGSIVRYDEQGTLHETMYTIGDKDGNPLANSPTNIYGRIQKVGSE